MKDHTHLARARLELTVLALGILVLGPVPYPQDLVTNLRQAEAYRKAREYGAALAAYQQAEELDPASAQPWLQMGEILLGQHRYVKAAAAFREAERLGGGPEALLGLGESLAGQGDWASAIRTWQHAREMAPDDASVQIALGRGSIAQSSFDQAARFLGQALEAQPAAHDAATAHALLGRLLLVDDPALAGEHLRQAGDQDMLAVLAAASAEPDPALRHLLLGAAFFQRGEITLSRCHFEHAVALAPANAEATAYLAHTLDRMGETGAARELLEHALDLDANSALAFYFLGVHHRQVGYVAGAQAALWEALLRDPENAAVRVAMAETFLDLGDYTHAEEWYQAAVDVADQDIEFHLLLARFYVDHLYRVEEGGLPAAEAAAALAPDDARAHDLLGWAYHLAGKHAEGEASLTHALALEPDLVSAHFHLGSLYAQINRVEQARWHLQRAVDLDTAGFYRNRAQSLLNDLERKSF